MSTHSSMTKHTVAVADSSMTKHTVAVADSSMTKHTVADSSMTCLLYTSDAADES